MLDRIRKLKQILTKREMLNLGILLVSILITAVLQAAGTFSVLPFIRLVMDSSIAFENKWLYMVYDVLNFPDVQSYIIFIGVVMFLILLSSNGLSAFTTWLKIRFVWMNNHRLSRRLLEKYLSMPYVYFLNQNTSDLSKNILAEVKHLTSSYLLPLLTIINSGLTALCVIIILIWVDVAVSFVAFFIIGGIYTLIYLRINKQLKLFGARRLETNMVLFKSVKEALNGIKEIKVLNREPFFLKRYTTASLENAHLQSWNAVVGQLPHYALEALAFGGIIIFVIFLLITRDDAYHVVPMAGLFVVAASRLMPSLKDLFKSFTKMQFNQAVLDRIYEDITAGEKIIEESKVTLKNLPEPLPFSQEIRLENVSYNYPNTIYPVVSDINILVKRNTSVAFVGPTGAGKTTLVDIILGLLPPQKGKLLVDGMVIDDTNLVNWQRMIGYVPQHIYLSDDTVVSNIAFGIPESEVDNETLERVARIANIHQFIAEDLPQGYQTRVGDRGIRLSGGQRQRIGIARALYHDPEILVFDEATSALDGITEEMVLEALENAARLKTLLVIAHRLTTIKNCDLVYMIDKGKIVGTGTYEELLGNNAQFRAMAKVKV